MLNTPYDVWLQTEEQSSLPLSLPCGLKTKPTKQDRKLVQLCKYDIMKEWLETSMQTCLFIRQH